LALLLADDDFAFVGFLVAEDLAFGAAFFAVVDFFALLAALAFGAAFFAEPDFDDVDAFDFVAAFFFAGAVFLVVLAAFAFGAAFFFAAGLVVDAAVFVVLRTLADDFFFVGFIFFPIEFIAPATAAVAASARISPAIPLALAITPFDVRLVVEFFIFD